MRTRSYRLGLRQAAVDRTRARVLGGARKFLKSRVAAKGFSLDAIARCADVTRATIYYQFKSKTGLLNAVYDNLASRAGLRDLLGRAFREESPAAAVKKIVAAYCRFWANDRVVIRRLHALADIDAGFRSSDRGEWRREAILGLLAKFKGRRARIAVRITPDVVDALHTLTSFETYDNLACGRRNEKGVVRLIADVAVRLVFHRPRHR